MTIKDKYIQQLENEIERLRKELEQKIDAQFIAQHNAYVESLNQSTTKGLAAYCGEEKITPFLYG